MTRRAAVLFFAVLTIFPVVAQGDTGGVRIVEARGSFPQRAYVLTLPHGASLSGGQVSVTENGRPAQRVSVTRVGSAGAQKTGTVLLIDASLSMRGEAIQAALNAARAFADRRNSNQQLAIATFNHATQVTLPFTTDSGEIDAALAKLPSLAQGTHIYDAVNEGISLIERAGLSVGTIVVLSDGADVGSTISRQKLVSALKSRHVRVFAVGLKSKTYDPSTLELLASVGQGSYAAASSSATLAGIYNALGFNLAHEYLLRYVSTAAPGQHVSVSVRVGTTGTATAGYLSPPLSVAIQKPISPSIFDRVIKSVLTMLVIALLIIGLAVYAVWVVVRPPRRTVVDRLGDFVTVSTDDEKRRQQEVLAALHRRDNTPHFEFWRSFSEDAALADIKIPPARIALLSIVAGFLFAIIAVVAVGVLGLFAFFLGPFGARWLVARKLKQRRQAFGEQLPDNLEVLASALRAGHSIVGALSVVVQDAAEPSKSEFGRVVADEQLGVPLDSALSVTVERMANRDLDQVAVVAALQREAGANSAEVIDQVVENIRGSQEVRRLVRVLTAQGRMARWIVSLLPVFLIVIITLLDKNYMHPLWHEAAGQFFLVIAGIMVIAGSFIIGRIVDIKV